MALLVLWPSVLNEPAPVPALPPGAGDALYLVLMGVCCAAIAVRRLAALPAVLVIGACLFLHLVAFEEISLLAIASCLVAVETTQSRLDPPWRWVLLGTAVLGTTGASLRAVSLVGDDADRIPFLLVPMWMAVALAAFIGGWRRRRRDRFEQALERAAVLEAQQETERHLAVARERQRIAREVHDLLGHSLSVIAMQAEGARAVLAADPPAADRALAVIGQTSRSSVDEVRALVDMLRTEEAPDTPAFAARPTPVAGGPASQAGSPAEPEDDPGADLVSALARLVGRARQAGAAVSLSLDLDREVDAGTGQVLHRVAQESLTNALRHAPGAACAVQLAVLAGRAELVVSNGPAHGAGCGDAPPTVRTREGFGLTSMRERVTALGGSLRAGAQPGGGWRVEARLALPAGATASTGGASGCDGGGDGGGEPASSALGVGA